jgi:alpha-N-arabinofuranosidase
MLRSRPQPRVYVNIHRLPEECDDGIFEPGHPDAAWHSVETNRFGLHEMAGWARAAGPELMQAVNLGTRGIAAAADLLEDANHPGGTELSDGRRRNGAEAPFDIRLWCLGNEPDGPWQIGHRTADEYGRLAAETARYLRMVDPRVELVDHVSLHAYVEEAGGDAASLLGTGAGLDRYVEDVAAILDEVGAGVAVEGTATREVGIAVDDWNVWYLSRWNDVDKDAVPGGEWREHPPLLAGPAAGDVPPVRADGRRPPGRRPDGRRGRAAARSRRHCGACACLS